MAERSTEIAIIGAGPAGAHLASRLAASGRDVTLFDPKGAWEKPCGGGVPTRAIREFAFLLENSGYPYNLVKSITVISPSQRRVSLRLKEPFAIYSRRVLNGLVLDRAMEAGAEFVRLSVVDFSRQGGLWEIKTGDGQIWRARFLIGADGAASFTRRRLVGIFPSRDLALALGYNITLPEEEPAQPGGANNNGTSKNEAVIRLLKNFTGYLWAFPRPGAMNFGVASKLGERPSLELRDLLKKFIVEYFGQPDIDFEQASFFGAKIPVLDKTTWSNLKASGDGWALIGDAAGFVDPITGEGLYYAFKSADLLAEALMVGNESGITFADKYNRATSNYERAWREAFGQELRRASQMLNRFYNGAFCGQIFGDAMVQFAKYHKGVRTVLMRAMVGEQSYVTLKRDLLIRAIQLF